MHIQHGDYVMPGHFRHPQVDYDKVRPFRKGYFMQLGLINRYPHGY